MAPQSVSRAYLHLPVAGYRYLWMSVDGSVQLGIDGQDGEEETESYAVEVDGLLSGIFNAAEIVIVASLRLA